MKCFLGLVFCILVGLAYSEDDRLSVSYCYLGKVFKYKLNADYSGGWCQHEPRIAKFQIDAAIECKTGFEEEARQYYYNLNKTCNEDLKKGLEGNCESDMFTSPGSECFKDYYAEFKKSGVNPFDPFASEGVLCKHFNRMMACQYEKVAEKCKTDYPVFVRVMDPYRQLQHRICEMLPSAS